MGQTLPKASRATSIMVITMALISSPLLLPPTGTQGLGDMPSHNQLLEAHVNELARICQTEQPHQHIPQTGSGQSGSGEKPTDEPDPSTSLTLGKGLSSLPKKLLERIWADIDLSELPPARVLPESGDFKRVKSWRVLETSSQISRPGLNASQCTRLLSPQNIRKGF